MIETYRGVVYPFHMDHMGHMNVQWYVAKFDSATWHLFSNLGITSAYIQNNNKGMAAVEQIIKYKEEALAGDLLVIKSRVLEMKEKSIRFIHVMFNSETQREIASCELVGVHIDRNKRKSCPFPENIYKKGTRLINRES
ncbi:MAG: thioesterase family protein [Desulfobacterales bacterium]